MIEQYGTKMPGKILLQRARKGIKMDAANNVITREQADPRLLAIVGVTSSSDNNYADLEAELRKALADRDMKVDVRSIDGRPEACVISIGHRTYTVSYMVPTGGAEAFASAISRTIAWPDAATAVAKVTGHFVVAPFQAQDDFQGALNAAADVTTIVSGICLSSDSEFVYWSASNTLIKPDSFIRQSKDLREKGQIPITCWFNYEPTSSNDGVSAINTKGMMPFIRKEVAVIRRGSASQILDTAIQLTEYLIKNGGAVGDGDSLDFPNGLKLVATVSTNLIVASENHIAA